MERLLLCALALLRPLDAVHTARTQEPSFQGRTTRGLPLCPNGNGQQPQHLDGPAGQGTPCPSLTAGCLTTRLDRLLWPTGGSLETKDSSSFKDDNPEYWTNKAIDLLLVVGAMLLSLLICWCLSLCWRALCPALRVPERIRLQTILSPSGQRDYGAIKDADGTLPSAAEGQDSPRVEEEEEENEDDKTTLLPTINSHEEAAPLSGLEGKSDPKSVSKAAV